MNRFANNTIAKFIAVGILNTLVGMAITFGLYNLAHCSYWISSAANYILVSCLSFFLNKRFTFRHQGQAVQSGLRFALNIAVCYFIAYTVAKPATVALLKTASPKIQENIALFVGMCIFVGLNYLGQRFFVFRKPS